MNTPNSNSEDTLLYNFVALAVQMTCVYGFSFLGWWALQPIFPDLSYPRFGTGMAFLFVYLQGIFKAK